MGGLRQRHRELPRHPAGRLQADLGPSCAQPVGGAPNTAAVAARLAGRVLRLHQVAHRRLLVALPVAPPHVPHRPAAAGGTAPRAAASGRPRRWWWRRWWWWWWWWRRQLEPAGKTAEGADSEFRHAEESAETHARAQSRGCSCGGMCAGGVGRTPRRKRKRKRRQPPPSRLGAHGQAAGGDVGRLGRSGCATATACSWGCARCRRWWRARRRTSGSEGHNRRRRRWPNGTAAALLCLATRRWRGG